MECICQLLRFDGSLAVTRTLRQWSAVNHIYYTFATVRPNRYYVVLALLKSSWFDEDLPSNVAVAIQNGASLRLKGVLAILDQAIRHLCFPRWLETPLGRSDARTLGHSDTPRPSLAINEPALRIVNMERKPLPDKANLNVNMARRTA